DAFCARSGISRAVLLLTCWSLLRCRIEATEAVLIGLGCDGRTHDVLQEMVGVLSRHVPFTFRWQHGQSFRELARAVEALQAEVLDEQHYFDPATFGEGEAAPSSEYGSCFEYVRLSGGCATEEPAFMTESLFSVSDRFRSKLTAIEEGRGLRLQLEYDAARL